MAITVYTYNDKVLKNVATDKWLSKKPWTPGPNEIRFKVIHGSTLNFPWPCNLTLISSDETGDVYDYSSTTIPAGDAASNFWNGGGVNLYAKCIEIIGLDLTGRTGFNFNSSGTSALVKIGKLYNYNSLTSVVNAFKNNVNVESGALAVYEQLSTLGSQLTNTADCFTDCGSNTVTGAAELAQIPTSWGGTAT